MSRRLVASYVAIALVVLLVLEVPLGVGFARSALDRRTIDLERDAGVIAAFVEDALEVDRPVDAPAWLRDYPRDTGVRVLVTDRDGITVLDSDAPTPEPRDYSSRPEVAAALAGARASGTRHSTTLGEDLLYVAVPVTSGGVVHGTVRLTHPRTALDAAIRDNWLLLGVIAVVVLGLTAVVGVMFARWVARPTREIEQTTSALADGQLDARAPTDTGPPELRRLGVGFNAMATRIGDLIAAQRDFVADASHQLRSPLAALRLELEDLREEADPHLVEGLERAIGETHRLGRIVDGLLVLARADTSEADPERIDVAAVMRERVELWEPLAAERGVQLQPRLEAAQASAIPEHLDQILDNLLDNALEVAPSDSVLRMTTTVTPTSVEIHVVDEGPGLSAGARERAFDRFWRSPDASAGSGSGLGLPIAQRLARSNGGDVRLDDAESGGVDAVVVLPRAEGRSAPVDVHGAVAAGTGPVTADRRLR